MSANKEKDQVASIALTAGSDELSPMRHPHEFSKGKKFYIASIVAFSMFNSTLSASLPGGTSPYVASYFTVSDPVKAILPSTTYLIGYIFGPLLFAPLSERFGRRNVLSSTGAIFLLASIGSIFASSWTLLLALRGLAGVGGSAPISIIGGVYADIYPDPMLRGQATAAYTVFTTLGTMLSPTICAYIADYSWRWTFVLTASLSFVALLGLCLLPETFVPYMMRSRAVVELDGEPQPGAKTSERPRNVANLLLRTVGRPVQLFWTEPIVLFCSLYSGLVFAIVFIFFVAYPYIFRSVYGMTHKTATLAFVPMGVGTALSLAICLAFDRWRASQVARGATWARKEEYRRLPLACLGGVLLITSMFWLAWSATPTIHWSVPMLAGIPFGMAVNLILMALFNYLTDAYGTYAASALAAASCTRSIMGAVLPLAQDRLYKALGICWATSVLGFCCLILAPVPFVFLRFGADLRKRSSFCSSLTT